MNKATDLTAVHEKSAILSDAGDTLIVWRGESSGQLFDTFDLRETNAGVGFFFAEQKALADGYARVGTEARPFRLSAHKVLDLRDPYAPAVRKFLRAYANLFDEWIDRYSGEDMDVFTFLESGSLYDYEGTGSGTRWNRLFEEAWEHGYDAVRVLDTTDGVPMGVVWVVRTAEQIDHVRPRVVAGVVIGNKEQPAVGGYETDGRPTAGRQPRM